MTSNYSDRYKLELQQTGANANTWGENTNNNLEVVDAFTAGYLSKSVAGSADVTLTTNNADPNAESSNKVIEFTGALTGDIKVFVPAVESNYIFFNNTTGSQTLTVAPTGHASNGVAVVQGAHTIMYNKGDAMVDLFANSLGTFSVKNSLTVNGTVLSSNGVINAAALSGNGAALTGVSSIPSGTTALFYQASAPTGWTQNTASTLNDCCLRVVTGSGAGVGGTDGFQTALASSKTTESKAVGFTVSSPGTATSGSGSTGSHTLSTPEIASHNHPTSGARFSPRVAYWQGNSTRSPALPNITSLPEGFPSSGSTGGAGGHDHPISAIPFTVAGPVTSDGVALSVPNMNVTHEDVIASTKD